MLDSYWSAISMQVMALLSGFAGVYTEVSV